MTKQEQIDLMVKCMFDYARTLVDIKTATEDSRFINGYKNTLRDYANFLYDNNYRKIPENAVVLTNEERLLRDYECFNTGYETGKAENANLLVKNEVLKRDVQNLERTLEEGKEELEYVRKETAKEIISFIESKDKIGVKYSIYTKLLQELKEKYLEVEE